MINAAFRIFPLYNWHKISNKTGYNTFHVSIISYYYVFLMGACLVHLACNWNSQGLGILFMVHSFHATIYTMSHFCCSELWILNIINQKTRSNARFTYGLKNCNHSIYHCYQFDSMCLTLNQPNQQSKQNQPQNLVCCISLWHHCVVLHTGCKLQYCRSVIQLKLNKILILFQIQSLLNWAHEHSFNDRISLWQLDTSYTDCHTAPITVKLISIKHDNNGEWTSIHVIKWEAQYKTKMFWWKHLCCCDDTDKMSGGKCYHNCLEQCKCFLQSPPMMWH